MAGKMKKNLIAVLMLVVIVCVFTGCKSEFDKELEVYGGDIVRYTQCLSADKECYVSCPIILNKKVNNIEFVNIDTDSEGTLRVSNANVDTNEYEEYKGYYVYYILMNIRCTEYNKAVNTDIEKIILNIDGQVVEYEIPYFNIKNTYYYCENYGYYEEENAIFISGNYAGLYGYAPDEDRNYDLTISSDKDIFLKSYMVADFIEINELKVNGKEYDSKTLNIEAKADVDIRFDYKMKLNDNIDEDNVVRASQIIIYEYEGKEYIWAYESGIYIWKDYMDYGNIKRYIDSL